MPARLSLCLRTVMPARLGFMAKVPARLGFMAKVPARLSLWV